MDCTLRGGGSVGARLTPVPVSGPGSEFGPVHFRKTRQSAKIEPMLKHCSANVCISADHLTMMSR